MALGASRWDVIKLTGSTAAGLAVVGVTVGLGLVYAVGDLLEWQLFGVITNNLPLAHRRSQRLLGIVSPACRGTCRALRGERRSDDRAAVGVAARRG